MRGRETRDGDVGALPSGPAAKRPAERVTAVVDQLQLVAVRNLAQAVPIGHAPNQIGNEHRFGLWPDHPLDRIDIVVQPGQEWFKAGDLVFYMGNVETFRLDGVSRPEAFRQTCLKSHLSYTGVREAVRRETAPA